jgi:surfeit locus 1 family protein
MTTALRQPRWLIAGLVVLLLAGLFIRLGIWQLDRLEQKREENAVGQERLAMETVPLEQLLDEAGGDLASIEYRRAGVTGTFDPENEVLIRSQVEQGQAGFHVITPLLTEDGDAILVNRGWVPLTMDRPPVDATPEAGMVSQQGWAHLTQTRPALGPVDPPGHADVLNRVDIERIEEQTGYELAPIYLVAAGEGGDALPIALDLPTFDEGPHLAYAIQWFGFAAVGLIGFYFLFRRKGGRSKIHGEVGHDLEVIETGEL